MAKVVAKARALAKDLGTCAVPGCGRFLNQRNSTGLCAGHAHKSGLCKCAQCRASGRAKTAPEPIVATAVIVVALPPPPPPRVSDRPDLKVVTIPYGQTSGGTNGYAPVTLPRAPWDR